MQLKDEFYNRHIVKQRLFDPIVQCFQANGHKYNLMNSAMLELFEYIRSATVSVHFFAFRTMSRRWFIAFKQDELKTLCNDLVERYIDQFKDVDYIKTFEGLKLRYEQQQDRLRAANDG